jgi:hypothetical protein
MKPALLVLVGLIVLLSDAVLSASAQARHPTSDAAKPTACRVSGLVVKLEGSVPLPSATVRLQNVDDHSRTFSAVTDVGGRFEVQGIDPGRYTIAGLPDYDAAANAGRCSWAWGLEESQGLKNDEEGYREENPGGDTLGSVLWRRVSVRA